MKDVGECVDAAFRRTGAKVVLALPLGIGKPVAIANEFWRRAVREPGIDLTIITALSLRRPQPVGDLETRLAAPLLARVFGDFEDLEYVRALRADELPSNVRVEEFFFEPGAWLDVEHSQQHYLSTNYTHIVRTLIARGVNVIAHLVAQRGEGTTREFSLGSNSDVTIDLLGELVSLRASGRDVVMLAQTHREMPFMLGAAALPADAFDFVLDEPRYERQIFCPPNPALATIDHAIGLHASSLVRDGGTLQIGLGELGDSVCYALLLRHQQNHSYRQALAELGGAHAARSAAEIGGLESFGAGLFASTEMFVDQMLDLYRAGILRRRVYDSLPLSRLIDHGRVTERFDAHILQDLCDVGVGPRLTAGEFRELRHFGVFRESCEYRDGRMRNESSEWIEADLGNPESRSAIARHCLGRELGNGCVLHAGFFLGPRDFYAKLRELAESDRRQFDMRGVGFINQLYGPDFELRCLQRRRARFINVTMMATLYGAAVSDALDDGRVVSGVGGQYNFVAMAHALADARSVLCVRATRRKEGVTSSNIVASYGHVTIPRHLRDIVITEYGVADLRGKTDAECVAAMLSIADSRFQPMLLSAARRAGKIGGDYSVPEAFRQNYPQRIERSLASHRRAGLFSEYPFGTDLTPEEIVLARALRFLKENTHNRWDRIRALAAAALLRPTATERPLLRRMNLESPGDRKALLLQKLVTWALRAA
jgi:acyl-CoA hydrolase